MRVSCRSSAKTSRSSRSRSSTSDTREAIGYEALVRGPWDSELHSPGELFEMAEEAGFTFELDCLCRRVALRSAKGLDPVKKLFLNCLPTAIHDPAREELLRALHSVASKIDANIIAEGI